MAHSKKLFERRKMRTRSQIRRKALGRVRLSVFRSGRHIYAQVIDDTKGATLASASTLDADIKGNGADSAAAVVVGKLIAERAKAAGIDTVVFDRGGYRYHGRVKALGDSAREAGLAF